MGFINSDFLLKSEYAKELYSSVDSLPIIDYHCHIPACEIAQDKTFSDLTELFLGHDHYKWRVMRTMGVHESFITGDAPPKEKFLRYAESVEYAAGNPLYTWTSLELLRVFGVDCPLTAQNAGEIYDFCTSELKNKALSAKKIMRRFNVQTVCTTDDIADSLENHRKIKSDGFEIRVLPTFRPDRFLNIERADFAQTMLDNGISSLGALCDFLLERLDFFCENGCAVADHGLDRFPTYLLGDGESRIFEKRLSGTLPTQNESDTFKLFLLGFLAKEYKKRNIAMQLHIGVLRNNNPRAFCELGADSGFDSPNDESFMHALSHFLGGLELSSALPRAVLYALNPECNAPLAAMAGNFTEAGVRAKIQHGSAWWFNDHRDGIRAQLKNLASLGVIGSFVGMLTDSRSFTSYVRHEYFRRILCDFLAELTLDGIYPKNTEKLKEIARDVSYYNALNFFDFDRCQKG